MTCQDAAFSDSVLDYIIGNYRGEEYIRETYRPDCYFAFDESQAVIYKEAARTGYENIEKYGFSAIPNVFGLMNEEELEASGVNQIRRQPYLDLYGQGVLIGFVDTGIDFTHEAFRSADNTSRILALWDQTIISGNGPERFPYGRVYTKEELDMALQEEKPEEIILTRDNIGHGTFLAGIAAGRENRSENFSGVAPLAELVVVKCKQAKNSYREYFGVPKDVPAFQENDIMAGVSFILEVARNARRSVVICIGMGTNMGSHDGESQLAVMLDRYTAYQGVAMVVSIGNEGNARHHHHITTSEDTISIDVEGNLDGFMTQLWWRTPGGLSLDIVSPSGDTLSNLRAFSGERRRKLFTLENTFVEVYFGIAQEQTRAQVVVIRFEQPKAGIWKVRVRSTQSNPSFHMWLPIRQFLPVDVFFLEPDPDTTSCSPSNGRNLIAVSAYNVADGALYLQASRGFTPQGDVKPEITAPGVNLTGPYPQGRYGTMTGTSVSAAFVAGIAALFFQQYQEFDISGIIVKELLIRGATPRGKPYPNTEWGYGIANAYESITNN